MKILIFLAIINILLIGENCEKRRSESDIRGIHCCDLSVSRLHVFSLPPKNLNKSVSSHFPNCYSNIISHKNLGSQDPKGGFFGLWREKVAIGIGEMIYLGGASSMTTLVSSSILNLTPNPQIKNPKHHPFSSVSKFSHSDIFTNTFSASPSLLSGNCRASQVAELFPTISPEIVVREARMEDCWEVAETHCSCFFPEYSFPLDFVLRIDRLIAMLFGFSIPKGCKRTCLVAVTGQDSLFSSDHDFKIGDFDGNFSLNKGFVAGILTVDTVADFLPRKGTLRQRRKGIAYMSNVAVRETFRRKGIAKRLIAKAEAKARTWGCRAVALHCDLNNPGAIKLYTSRGFKSIKVPQGADWPQPKMSADMQFSFMMKLL